MSDEGMSSSGHPFLPRCARRTNINAANATPYREAPRMNVASGSVSTVAEYKLLKTIGARTCPNSVVIVPMELVRRPRSE